MNPKTILIVDDAAHVKKILDLTISRAGYKVKTASNGLEALSMIKEQPPDVLITDIEMPKMSGKELCQTIHRDIPDRNFLIIVMTSVTERDARNWLPDIGNAEFMEKPLSPKRIIERLDDFFSPASTQV